MSNTIKIQHDEQREKDVQSLAKAIVNMTPNYYYNSNGSYIYSCPICHKRTYTIGAEMQDIKHKPDCAWLIAKDLKTNL